MGCTSSALISGPMPAPSGAVTVEACHRGVCTKLENADANGCHSVNQLPHLQVCFTPGATTTEIDVTVSPAFDAPLADGDTYTVQVRDASNTLLVDFTGNATYEEFRPNGAGCDPACKSAELSF